MQQPGSPPRSQLPLDKAIPKNHGNPLLTLRLSIDSPIKYPKVGEAIISMIGWLVFHSTRTR